MLNEKNSLILENLEQTQKHKSKKVKILKVIELCRYKSSVEGT